MPKRSIPNRPSLDFLRKKAKENLLLMQKNQPQLKLAEAQHRLAQDYGFNNWAKLKQHFAHPDRISIEAALQTLRAGKPVILYDDCGQEDEGDFVFAAEKMTSEAVNFLIKNARGTLCLALSPEQVDRLQLPLIREQRESKSHPAFTVSIDAREGISTGVSAADRAKTILAAVADDAGPDSVRSPGHVFPLRAVPGGLKERLGHTEASIEMVKRAGLKPAAAICEILNDDGTMARLKDVKELSVKLGIPLLCFSELKR